MKHLDTCKIRLANTSTLGYLSRHDEFQLDHYARDNKISREQARKDVKLLVKEGVIKVSDGGIKSSSGQQYNQKFTIL